MPIVVKHEPSAGAVMEMGAIGGRGAYTKWKTEFEARQKQYAMQNLFSGISAGQSLAQPFMQVAQQQATRDHQIAMYEKAQGDKLLGEQKKAKGENALFQSIFGPEGVLGTANGGRPYFTPEDMKRLAENPSAISSANRAGMGALQATITANQATDPEMIRRRIAAQTATADATREARQTQIGNLQRALIADNNFKFSMDKDGVFSSPDPAANKRYQELVAQKNRVKLGLREVPLAATVQGRTLPLGNGNYWVEKKNGDIELQNEKNMGGGVGAGGKTYRYPQPSGRADGAWPKESTPDQMHTWREDRGKIEAKIKELEKVSPLVESDWSSQTEKLRTSIETFSDAILTEQDPTTKAQHEATLKRKKAELAEHMLTAPRGKSSATIRYAAQAQMFRNTRLKEPLDEEWEYDPRLLDDAHPRWKQALPDFKGGSNIDLLQHLENTRGIPRSRAKEMIFPSSSTVTQFPLAPKPQQRQRPRLPWMQQQQMQQQQMQQQQMQQQQQPLDPPRPPMPTTQKDPRQMAPIRGSMPEISKVAGPEVASAAMGRLNGRLGGTTERPSGVIMGIQRALADPRVSKDLSNWVSKGRSVASRHGSTEWPGLKLMFKELEDQEFGQARRFRSGEKPATTSTSPGAPPSARTLKQQTGRYKNIKGVIDKHRDKIAGILEASAKWSLMAKAPLSPANIPSPTSEEFIRMVDRGMLKAGDVLIAPPVYEYGVMKSGPSFMVLTGKAIVAARDAR